MSAYPVHRVARFFRNHPWALERTKLDAIHELIDARMRGVTFTPDEIRARIGTGGTVSASTSIVNGVAVIPLMGVLAQKMNAMTAISGGTSVEMFMAQVRQAFDDPSIKTIVLDCDTPGGMIEGVIEAADQLFAWRGTKRFVAVANPWIASAGYWLASQCDEIVCMPSGRVGSIGIFIMHEDWSAANAEEGYKPTYVYAGEHKVELNDDEPLSDSARAYLQAQVDTRYAEFVRAVARGRGVPVSVVKESFGQGRMVFAKDALQARMIDRIGTLDDVVARLGGRRSASARINAELVSVERPASASVDTHDEHPSMAGMDDQPVPLSLASVALPLPAAAAVDDPIKPVDSAVDDPGLMCAACVRALADQAAIVAALSR